MRQVQLLPNQEPLQYAVLPSAILNVKNKQFPRVKYLHCLKHSQCDCCLLKNYLTNDHLADLALCPRFLLIQHDCSSPPLSVVTFKSWWDLRCNTGAGLMLP